jgi:hypothetical protein
MYGIRQYSLHTLLIYLTEVAGVVWSGRPSPVVFTPRWS